LDLCFYCRLYPAYAAYQEKSFIAGHYQDASKSCGKLGKDESLAGSRPGIIDSEKLKPSKMTLPK